jgi:hypothetical protein
MYSKRIFAVALCQGAALHIVDNANGIKDFDVWTFYTEHPARPFPYRRRAEVDFGRSKFGRTDGAPACFVGRKVDLIGRSIPGAVRSNPIETLQRYLSERTTKSAWCLAKKAVVMIEPKRLVGTIVWQPPRPMSARPNNKG